MKKSPIRRTLVAATAALSLVPATLPYAQAAIVDTPVVLSAATRAAQIEKLQTTLQRADVAAQLEQLGVDADAVTQRVLQFGHPLSGSRKETVTDSRIGGPLSPCRELSLDAPNQPAPFPFHLHESRKCRRQAQTRGIARVDPPDQRLYDSFIHFPSEPAPGKRRDALIVRGPSPWHEVLRRGPQFARR